MRPLNVSLEGLIALVTVAQEGNLERGGRTLGQGKSAMSKQITGLEQAVGAPLFDRWRGRWILNEDGRLLAAKAFQAILDIRTGLDLVQSHVRLRADHFAVGDSTFLSPILIGIIRQIELKRHGDVTIEYESRLTESSVKRVVRGELDAGFGYLPIREPDLLVRKVFEEPLAACLPEGHKLAA
jgi:DNA-binding transcriptional LysR family regulator